MKKAFDHKINDIQSKSVHNVVTAIGYYNMYNAD